MVALPRLIARLRAFTFRDEDFSLILLNNFGPDFLGMPPWYLRFTRSTEKTAEPRYDDI